MSDSEIAKQFVQFYYSTFDNDRSQLVSLYRPHSMLTFEGTQVMGVEAIGEKLRSLPFQKVKHQVVTVDAQPSNPQQGPMIVTVTGALLVDEESNPHQFSQTFQLVPDNGSFYVFNDIFRLNYGF